MSESSVAVHSALERPSAAFLLAGGAAGRGQMGVGGGHSPKFRYAQLPSRTHPSAPEVTKKTQGEEGQGLSHGVTVLRRVGGLK